MEGRVAAWDSNSHGARPVHLIITMIKWIRTRRLSIKKSLSVPGPQAAQRLEGEISAMEGRVAAWESTRLALVAQVIGAILWAFFV